MASLRRVRVPGPLEPYSDGFAEFLQQLGYSPWTVKSDLVLMGRLSRWLVEHDLAASGLTTVEVDRFARGLRGEGPGRRRSPKGLTPLVRYLREQGVIPEFSAEVADDVLGRLLDEFVSFLVDERGLAAGTVWYYRATARRFLSRSSALRGVSNAGLDEVTAATIRSFVLSESRTRGVGSVKNVVTALRALLRFCHTRGYVPTSLAGAVPAVASWRQVSLPRTVRSDDLSRLLASCDRRTAVGRRDYAILVVLSRLGLRTREVATLTVDDIAWRDGELLVHGKGNRHDRLPLPVDVGGAIADYCRWGRRQGACRGLFLHVRAPYGVLSSSAVGKVVERACDRGGLARLSAHQFRHATATALRQAGAPLFEIGQVLRHAHPVTTAGYGSITAPELVAVAQVWPGGSR